MQDIGDEDEEISQHSVTSLFFGQPTRYIVTVNWCADAKHTVLATMYRRVTVVQYLGVQYVVHDRYHVQYVGHIGHVLHGELAYVVVQPMYTRLGQFYVMCKP